MFGPTWTWNGRTIDPDCSSDWTPTPGAGNGAGHPQAGDTESDAAGRIFPGTDPRCTGDTAGLRGTAGLVASFSLGDAAPTFVSPSLDSNPLLTAPSRESPPKKREC
jgi:hypothetical protein